MADHVGLMMFSREGRIRLFLAFLILVLVLTNSQSLQVSYLSQVLLTELFETQSRELSLRIASEIEREADEPTRVLTSRLASIAEAAAIQGSDAVYTDRWSAPGHPVDDARAELLAPFPVSAQLMAMAKPDAFFMHCLPAERGREVTAEVIDGPQSVVFEQAQNRLHVQKAILTMLLGR